VHEGEKSCLVSDETGFDFFVGGIGIEIIVMSTKAGGAGFVECPWVEVTAFLRIRIFK